MANTQDFDDAIGMIEAESVRSTIVLACTEKAPTNFHRALPVSHQLHRRGPGVGNIWVDQPGPQCHAELLRSWQMRRHRVDDPDLSVDANSTTTAYRRRT